MTVIMDYPAAWAFVRNTKPEDHHERCSWRTQNGALLCDCDVLWDEYVRRGGTDPRVSTPTTESPSLREQLEALRVGLDNLSRMRNERDDRLTEVGMAQYARILLASLSNPASSLGADEAREDASPAQKAPPSGRAT